MQPQAFKSTQKLLKNVNIISLVFPTRFICVYFQVASEHLSVSNKNALCVCYAKQKQKQQ